MSLAACSTGQKPYQVFGNSGNTPEQACLDWIVGATQSGYDKYYVGASGCMVGKVSTNAHVWGQITQVCEPAEPHYAAVPLGAGASARIADMAVLWGLFLGAAIVIICLRKFANIWERAPHGEN